jgi:hypothetical protein
MGSTFGLREGTERIGPGAKSFRKEHGYPRQKQIPNGSWLQDPLGRNSRKLPAHHNSPANFRSGAGSKILEMGFPVGCGGRAVSYRIFGCNEYRRLIRGIFPNILLRRIHFGV